MKRIILAALLLSLAGCTEPAPNAHDGDADPTGQPAVNETRMPLSLSIDQAEMVLQGTDTATISGTTSDGATISYLYDRDLGGLATLDNGTWSATFTVPFGHTIVEVFADDGVETLREEVLVKRNMELTVTIDHDPAQGKADRSDTFYWDHGSLRSMNDASYEGCEQPHPERANAHDALLDYSDIVGVPITYTDCGSFGVSVDVVDDVDYGPLGWCFNVNGEAAEFGISLLELNDGDVFAFVNCSGFGG